MRKAFAVLFGAGFLLFLGTSFALCQEADASKFSLVGNWKGTYKIQTFVQFTVHTTFRADKTYTTTTISSYNTVTSENGTFEYQFQSGNSGILTSQPSADGPSWQTVGQITWINPNQFHYKGAAAQITMTRMK